MWRLPLVAHRGLACMPFTVDKPLQLRASMNMTYPCTQGDKEFNVEVSTLSRLQHPSIVSLLGICVEGDQRIAVFELLQRGSLSSALRPDEGPRGGKRLPAHGPAGCAQRGEPLPWRERVQIALDTAQGLAYLHKVRNLTVHWQSRLVSQT